MASNPCKRRRTDLNGDKKREICVYKDAHPKATCSDIAAHFAKEWDVTVDRTKVGDILIKTCNYIFEIIKLYLYHIYVVILFAQPIHVLI